MQINRIAVLKAGSLSAVIGLIVALLVTIPFQSSVGVASGPDSIGILLWLTGTIPSLGCILMPLLSVAFAVFPLISGLAYGFLTQGSGNRLLGGALSGVFGGLLYGIASTAISLMNSRGSAVFLQDVDNVAAIGSTSLIGTVISLGASLLIGLTFGAFGGALWLRFQRRFQPPS